MTPAGIEPAKFRYVAQHLNHCATAVPTSLNVELWNIDKLYIVKSNFLTKYCMEKQQGNARINQ